MLNKKIPYVCTQTNLIIYHDGQKIITFSGNVERNKFIKALESYNNSSTSLEQLMAVLIPIKRIQLQSDSRFDIVDGKALYLRGSDIQIPEFLSNKILDFINSNLSIDSLVEFWKSCLENRYYEAIEELFEFCTKNNMPIQADGSVIGYKKLNFVNNVQVPSEFEEIIMTGDIVTYVDGKVVDRELADRYLKFITEANSPQMTNVHQGTNNPIQRIGEIVKWVGSRDIDVDYQKSRSCTSAGFHIAGYGYHFSGDVRLLVSFFPKDVVAASAGEKKLRVWEYKLETFVDSQKEITQKLIGSNATFRSEVVPDEITTYDYELGQEVIYIGIGQNFYPGNTYTIEEMDEEKSSVLLINRYGDIEWVDIEDIKEKI